MHLGTKLGRLLAKPLFWDILIFITITRGLYVVAHKVVCDKQSIELEGKCLFIWREGYDYNQTTSAFTDNYYRVNIAWGRPLNLDEANLITVRPM